MRRSTELSLVCLLLAMVPRATPAQAPASGASSAPAYDAALARKLKADDDGMRTYVMAFLKAGPNRDRSPEEAARLQRAHRGNINRLANEGKLVLAGPFADDGPLRGIYVFDVSTVAEAEALTRTDPAIQAGQLVMELHPWYGSAALLTVNEVHGRIVKPNP
jgi:uncharacterized protein YciI